MVPAYKYFACLTILSRFDKRAHDLCIDVLTVFLLSGVPCQSNAQDSQKSSPRCFPVGTRDINGHCHPTKIGADFANARILHERSGSKGSGALTQVEAQQQRECVQYQSISGGRVEDCALDPRVLEAQRSAEAVAELSCPSCSYVDNPAKAGCHTLREKLGAFLGGLLGGEGGKSVAEWSLAGYGHAQDFREAFQGVDPPSGSISKQAVDDCK